MNENTFRPTNQMEYNFTNSLMLGEGTPGYAQDVIYDNTTSGLESGNVQDALDEVNNKIDSQYSNTDIDGFLGEVYAEFDLYYTKEEVDALLENLEIGGGDLTNYYTKEEVNGIFTGYYTKEEVDGMLSVLTAEDIPLNTNEYENVSTYQAVNFLNSTKANISDMYVDKLLNVEPTSNPGVLFKDLDGIYRHIPLTERGIDTTQYAKIFIIQDTPILGGGPVTLTGDSTLVQGTEFTIINNNTLHLTPTDSKTYDLSCVMSFDLSQFWVNTLPIHLKIDAIFNGLETGVSVEKTLDSYGSVILKLHTTSALLGLTDEENDTFLTGNLQLRLTIKDDQGTIPGTWATCIVKNESFIQVFKRDLQTNGLYFRNEDIFSKRLYITKSSNVTVPTTIDTVTWDVSSLVSNTSDIWFDEPTNTFVLDVKEPMGYTFNLILPITKTSTTGTLRLCMKIMDNFGELYRGVIRDIVVVAGNTTLEYRGHIPFLEAGIYQVKVFWENDATGTITHTPTSQFVEGVTINQLGSFEILQNSAT